PFSSVFPTNRVIAGHYKGLTFFDYKNNQFSFAESIPGFSESSRFVVLDNNKNIWVSHPYHGVFKVTAEANGKYKTKLYTDKDGLPSSLNNHIYEIKNEMLVATEKGIYNYNPANDRFEVSAFYKNILGEQSIRYLKEDKEGNIWFVHEKNPGVIDLSEKEPVIIYLSELNNKLLSGFEFLYPVNSKNIFISGEKGFFHINYEKYKKNLPKLQVHIRSVRIVNKKDSLLFGGYFSNPNEKQLQAGNQVPGIEHKWGTIRIEFSAPLFGQQQNLEYSYRLKGIDNSWSEWSSKTDKEYTHLPAGVYTFDVKVRNNLGNESEVTSYTFRILPPWYQTIWAYIIYAVIIAIGLFYLIKWQRKKFRLQQARYEEEQRRLQYLHQLEMNKAENELVALRNEKLQAEIDFKNSELATSAMHLVQRGELLSKLKADLHHVMKGIENEKSAAEIKKLIKVLGEDEKMDKDWDHFSRHFDKVQSDFIIGLKEKHPKLTPNEIKLCAYLRMNLSTKEIAQLMNISVRGVEISRYRLRKKLGISSETSLFDHLISIH
ncbi:MAG TPA: triple tyrosine motif-containing protein, partial [Chitinophagaceae bacterium]|nr:triple tyrosine motif-containing protein [Chitinophagaceae bacterium]